MKKSVKELSAKAIKNVSSIKGGETDYNVVKAVKSLTGLGLKEA